MARLGLLLLALGGCGRVSFDPLGDAGGSMPVDGSQGGGDGPPADGAPIASGCGSTVIIDDDFTTAGTPGWTLVNTGSFNTAKLSGIQRFSVNANATANTRAAYQQTMSNPLAGTCVIAELSLASSAAMLRSYLRIGAPTKNIEIYVEAGQLWARFTTNGGATTGTNGPVAYSPTQMRFLRIRSTGAQSYALEYGPSLTSWNSFGSQGGSLVDPSPTFVEFGALAAGNQTVASTVEFERVLMLAP